MASSRETRFLVSTRGRVVTLLRRGGRTVEELARALGLTPNAVRGHLATLERDGLVAPRGARRGAGKPAAVYALTPRAERLFPKPYGLVLHELLDVLAGRLPPAALAAALRETGARLGARLAPRWAAPGDTGRGGRPRDEAGERRRAEGAVSLLGELGGLAELEQQGDVLLIRGLSCPIADAVQDHPEACGLAAALLAEAIGAPVRERCPRAGPARCLFEVPLT